MKEDINALKVGDSYVRIKIDDEVIVLLYETFIDDDGFINVRKKKCLQNNGEWLEVVEGGKMTPISIVYKMDELFL